jgi:topoisomerase-4 subunit A
LLELSVQQTVTELRLELEIQKNDLEEKWHFKSLEQIFIEEKIYRKIEVAESWEAILSLVDKGLRPFRSKFLRDVTEDDIKRLVEIPIRRISRYDAKRANEEMIALQGRIQETEKNLKHLTKYAIAYYENLLEKYGKGRERKTKLRQLEEIDASEVILSNLKVYLDAANGFVGTGIRNGELIGEFSSLDEIIAFKEDGTFCVTKVSDKSFVGNKVVHAAKFDRNDDKTVYNLLYRDGRGGPTLVKRFPVGGITRDKQYDLTKGAPQSKIHYLALQPGSSADKVVVHLVPQPRIRTEVPLNFEEYPVRPRGAQGVIVTKHAVKRVERLIKAPEGQPRLV